ncbi:DUF58 domain-containing protein [Granulosicoccus antarcticus]|uniref:Uncharacterized protein n=1 Tax=Granulosicoccus antarcticus IMCC3135 TaxID=1192854 RepID=A0A2Z2P4W3_9GAMM|nr:DUF58 domain-containing protein [Granulosicoccus antarcticus]ASJ76510.1 hypothetical protein IMCC3135_32325 [Granulosicoccus antarcticus IMCC3135]
MNLSGNAIRQRIFRTRAEDKLPHGITHQRIYIVPTRRGLAFLMALLIMLLASVNYSLSLGYALSFLLTGLFAATLLHTYRNVAGLQVLHASGDTCFAGQLLDFNIQLGNPGTQVRHGICIHTRSIRGNGKRLEAEQDSTFTVQLPTHERGMLELGRLTVQSDWPLGLWTCWSYLHVPLRGLVFPRPESDPPPVPASGEGVAGNQQKTSQQGDVSGLRAYVPGDSIGSIAWKSAARGQGLQVRTFDTQTAPAQALLNLQQTGIHSLEEQLSRLCAWVLAAEQQQVDYALQLPGEQLAAGQGSDQRKQALTALALHGQPSIPAA